MKALDRVPVWRRLQAIPDQVDDLDRRVAELEDKLGGKWPADVCRFCGARAARLDFNTPAGDQGIAREEWACGECGRIDIRSVKAK